MEASKGLFWRWRAETPTQICIYALCVSVVLSVLLWKGKLVTQDEVYIKVPRLMFSSLLCVRDPPPLQYPSDQTACKLGLSDRGFL